MSRPRGPYVTFAKLCVAMAPTPAFANGTTTPTPSTFDATATPHSFVSGSRATIENVFTFGAGAGASDDAAPNPTVKHTPRKRPIAHFISPPFFWSAVARHRFGVVVSDE